MEGKRFDQLVRALTTRGSRRRVLGGFLTGALGGLCIRPTAADDSGTAIADASGGNHNLASAADQASAGQDHDQDHDHEHDDNGGHDHDDHGDGGRRGAESCPCFEETCCGRNETCCPQFNDSETQIGLICCDGFTSCACGDCVPFCDLNVPVARCECNCPAGTNTCTQLDPSTQPFTCCRSDQTCCRVGEGADAVGTCCDDATETCTPGVGCSTS